MYDLSSISATAAAGVLSHLLYYIRGYRTPESLQIIANHAVLLVALVGILTWSRGFTSGLSLAFIHWISFHLGLFSSIVVYRTFFHPLRHFPGPFWARVSKIYSIVLAQDGKRHERETEWARRWGTFVRTGPDELLVTSVDAIQKVHRANAPVTKHGSAYDLRHLKSAFAVNELMDREDHRRRRQIWDRAMSARAVEQNEGRIRQVVHSWLDKLKAAEAVRDPINTSLYTLLIPFDIVGNLGFSIDFGTVEAGKHDPMLDLLEYTNMMIGKFAQCSWPISIFAGLNLGSEYAKYDEIAGNLVKKNEGHSGEPQNAVQYFLQDYQSEKPISFFDRDTVRCDAQGILGGGTDTIAAALAFGLYYLARDDGSLQDLLRRELEPAFGTSVCEEFVHRDLVGLPILDSIINEILRMHSPVCQGGPRVLEEQGLWVDGIYIPGGTTVFLGVHTIHRSPKYFIQADDFIPERWTSRPDLVLDKRAFHPFLIGPYACAGKQVAMATMRLVLAYTIWHYKLRLAPDEDGSSILADSKNQLVLKPGRLECVFQGRV